MIFCVNSMCIKEHVGKEFPQLRFIIRQSAKKEPHPFAGQGCLDNFSRENYPKYSNTFFSIRFAGAS